MSRRDLTLSSIQRCSKDELVALVVELGSRLERVIDAAQRVREDCDPAVLHPGRSAVIDLGVVLDAQRDRARLRFVGDDEI